MLDDRPTWELDLERASEGDVDACGDVLAGDALVPIQAWRDVTARYKAEAQARRGLDASGQPTEELCARLTREHQAWLDARPCRAA